MIITAIETQMENLRPSERLVAHYILGRPNVVVHMSIADLAESVIVSEPTIMRFCKALGCTGFMEFKLALARDLERRTLQRNRSNPAVKGPTVFGQAVFSRTLATLEARSKLLALDRIDEILEYCATSRAVTLVHDGSEQTLANLIVDALMTCRIEATAQWDANIVGRLDGRMVIGLHSAKSLPGFERLCRDMSDGGGKIVALGFQGVAPCISIPLVREVPDLSKIAETRIENMQDELLYLALGEVLRISIATRLSRSGMFSDAAAEELQSQREIAYGDARRRDRQSAIALDALVDEAQVHDALLSSQDDQAHISNLAKETV